MACIQARFRLDRPGFTLNADLSIPDRGVTALFGHSGSGKTTLLRCIAGLERVPGGFLNVNGDIWQDGRRWLPPYLRPVGYVFQETSLFPHLTVLGNLRYGMKRIAAAHRPSLDFAVELLGINHLLDRKPDQLSGGERSRVGIARALAVNPRLLLMDEPLAALDLKRKQEIVPYLEQLHEELDIPVIYVSHSPDEVARLADQLVVLEDGNVLTSGPLQETLTRLDLPIHLGEDLGAVLDVKVGAVDESWHLARMDFSGGSLWIPDGGLPVGRKSRVRVLARDVSIANRHPGQSSIQNVLCGRVDKVADDEHPASALVRVKVGDNVLVARLSKRAVSELSLTAGQEIWVQIKTVALIR